MHIIFMRSWNRNGKRFGSCISLFSKNNKFPCYQRSTQVIYMQFCCINHYNHLVWYDIHTQVWRSSIFFLHLNEDKDRFWAKSHQNQNCTIVRSVLFMKELYCLFLFCYLKFTIYCTLDFIYLFTMHF